MRLLVLYGWAWVVSGVEMTDAPLPGKLGGSVLLKPNASAEIASITWKQGPDLAVQWDGTNLNSYRQFKTRSTLDVKTGILTIKDLVISDTNTYTPEINNVLQKEILLKVYRPVPKPKTEFVLVKGEYCDLTCDGNTTDAEPVTYSWTKDNVMMKETLREITLKWGECSSSFTCKMTNPVSVEESLAVVPNPTLGKLLGLGLGLGLPLLLLLLAIIHRLLTGEWFYQKGPKCWTADFWERSTNPTNDAAREESVNLANNRG